MTDTTNTSMLAVVLAELGWTPAVLARRLNCFAALHGRSERVHAKTPYKWLRGDRSRSPWPALTAALLTGELGRPVTTPIWVGTVMTSRRSRRSVGWCCPGLWPGACTRPGWSPTLGAWTDGFCGGDPDGEVDSARCVGHLARLVDHLAPYRRRPAVRQLTEQATGLLTSH